MARIGLMLYSVRRACADDFQATLGTVAAMGYAGVEVFDLHGHAVADVRGWLDRDGLEVCGLHATLDAVEADLAGLAVTAKALGTSRLVVSWVSPPTSAADVASIRDRLETATAAASSVGLTLGFHNHDSELRRFGDDLSLLEQLLAEMPQLELELDLGWVWFAGVDPVGLVTRATGRAPLVLNREEHSYCPVGDGAVGYDVVAPAAVAAGVDWLLVEQDEVEGPELDAAARSLAALASFVAGAA